MAEQGSVLVTFDIVGEGFKHTMEVPASAEFGQLKVELAAALNISPDQIGLLVGGKCASFAAKWIASNLAVFV